MNRRLVFVMVLALMVVFTACAPAAPQIIEVPKEVVVEKPVLETVVVEKEVVVERTVVVEKEVEVEKVVVATPVPSPTAPPRTLRIATTLDIKMPMDPHNTTHTTANMINYSVYEGLVKYNADKGIYEPMLAESWDVSPDGLTWTFTLKEGVKFSTGKPVSADAVRFSLTRPVISSSWLAWQLTPYIDENSIEVVDERTVSITLLKPFGGFLGILSSGVAAIMDPEPVMANQTDGDMGKVWLDDHSVGAGPFMYQEHIRGQRVVLVPNPHYHGAPAALERVIVLHVPEPAQQAMMLEKGDIDVALDIPVDQEQLMKDKGLQVVKGSNPSVAYMAMTMTFKPFDDLRVRQALRYAVDYDGIINDLLLGSVTPASGIVGKGVFGYNPDFELKQDLEKAKALLAEAGYAEGFEMKLYSWSNDKVFTDVALKIQSDLAPLGITVSYIAQDISTLFEAYKAGKVPAILWYWGPAYPDADAIITQHGDKNHQGCQRLSWLNDETTRLIEEARVVSGLVERQELYDQAQKIIVEEGPYVFLYQLGRTFITSPRVEGLNVIPFGMIDLRSVKVN